MQRRPPDFESIPAVFAAAGVQAVLLSGGANPDRIGSGPVAVSGSASRVPDHTLQLLIPRAQLDAAVRVLEPLAWRYAWVRGGLLRLLPMRQYWWDGGSEVEVYWSLPAAPLPSIALASLTRTIRRTVVPVEAGTRRAGQAGLLAHLAVQSCRPGRSHEDDWARFKEVRASITDLAGVESLARGAGVWRAVRSAITAADAGKDRPERGPVYDGPTEIAWRMACAIQQRARPRRLKRLLAGTPWFGDTAIRCRVGGIEVTAGPGVFVPSADADLFVDVALGSLEGKAAPTVVEVGTGCGAIALALAHARPDAEVHGAELSATAVRWARRNARGLGLDRVRFAVGSLLDPVPSSLRGHVDLIIANLPYFPAREYMAIGSVPRGTIQGDGDDGLDLIRRLARTALPILAPGGGLLLQMFAWQWELLSGELTALGYRPGTPRHAGTFVIAPAKLIGQETNA